MHGSDVVDDVDDVDDGGATGLQATKLFPQGSKIPDAKHYGRFCERASQDLVWFELRH